VATHPYAEPGVYTATLKVVGGGPAVATAQVTVLPALEEEKVSWQLDGGAVDDEGRVFKAGTTEAWDSGAVSSQTLSGDGHLEFTAADAHTRRLAGLQARGATNDAAGVERGILLREDGTADAVLFPASQRRHRDRHPV
jgi:hypothetical protein